MIALMGMNLLYRCENEHLSTFTCICTNCDKFFFYFNAEFMFFFPLFLFREGDDWYLKEGEIDTLYFPANYINEEVITLYIHIISSSFVYVHSFYNMWYHTENFVRSVWLPVNAY